MLLCHLSIHIAFTVWGILWSSTELKKLAIQKYVWEQRLGPECFPVPFTLSLLIPPLLAHIQQELMSVFPVDPELSEFIMIPISDIAPVSEGLAAPSVQG